MAAAKFSITHVPCALQIADLRLREEHDEIAPDGKKYRIFSEDKLIFPIRIRVELKDIREVSPGEFRPTTMTPQQEQEYVDLLRAAW